MMRFTLALLVILGFSPLLLQANSLENPGFEEGAKAWGIRDNMSSVVADTFHTGTQALRVLDNSPTAGCSVNSAQFPLKEGQQIELSFWAKTDKAGMVGVYFWFYNASGKIINDPKEKAGGGNPGVIVKQGDGQWHDYKLPATAPAGAVSVAIWIHSFGASLGTVDFDDFDLTGIEAGVVPIAAESKVVPPTPVFVMPDLSARKSPPMVVIKVDDFRPYNGNVAPLWKKLADYMDSKNLKFSIGVIMDKTNEGSPEYLQWVRDKQASGKIEFWFHGWDHAGHEVDGKKFNEFNNRSYEDQKKHFDDSQKLALEKFGFAFASFGAGGGAPSPGTDENTIRVLADDPYMKSWMYGQPMDPAAKKLDDAGKVKVFDRVWAVNLEPKVGVPDYEKFVVGWAKNPDRTYFILQGHPMHWGSEALFEQYTKIIDFLVEQKAEFVTPSELAARLKATPTQ